MRVTWRSKDRQIGAGAGLAAEGCGRHNGCAGGNKKGQPPCLMATPFKEF